MNVIESDNALHYPTPAVGFGNHATFFNRLRCVPQLQISTFTYVSDRSEQTIRVAEHACYQHRVRLDVAHQIEFTHRVRNARYKPQAKLFPGDLAECVHFDGDLRSRFSAAPNLIRITEGPATEHTDKIERRERFIIRCVVFAQFICDEAMEAMSIFSQLSIEPTDSADGQLPLF